MVTGTHPQDVELFDYVEGDLAPDRRGLIEVHLATCGSCAEHVARVRAGRDALREAQFVNLPARRRDAVLRDLPPQRQAPARTRAFSPKRLIAVLAAIAVVAALAVALVNTGGVGSGSEEGAGGGGEAAGATTGAQDEMTIPQAAQALKVGGPAAAVAEELREEGFDARVVGNRVEVRGATRAEVERALANRRTLSSRDVKVVIVP